MSSGKIRHLNAPGCTADNEYPAEVPCQLSQSGGQVDRIPHEGTGNGVEKRNSLALLMSLNEIMVANKEPVKNKLAFPPSEVKYLISA